MSNIVIGKADGRNVSIDLDVLLRTRLLIQANSGGGKSWLMRRLAEQMFGKVPVIIIDPEGEFATLREQFDFVLVGKGGETPADPRSAALLAHKLLELRASAVCDLYEMKSSTRHEWVRLFMDAMTDAPKNLWRPTVVFVDEAQMFCPEKSAGESEASDAMIASTGRWRKRRFCAIWATQRLALVNKNATSMLLNRLVGSTFEDVDLKRAADLLSIAPADRRAFDSQMRILEPGNFFALGRAITKERLLVHVGSVETSHEIESGKKAMEPPPAPDKIKALLPKLADLPKAAEEKAKTEAELRGEIRSLKSQLRAQPTVAKEVKVVDQQAIDKAVRETYKKLGDSQMAMQNAVKRQWRALKDIAEAAARAASLEIPEIADVKFRVQKTLPSNQPNRTEIKPPAPQYVAPRSDASVENNGNKLRSGAERMLAALATWHPNGMTEGQMRAHAGLKKSGTFSAYMSDLRKGYIEERDGMVFATQSGLDYCKHIPAAPQSTEEVLDIWKPKLRDGARRMLDALVQAGGEPISKEQLGELAQLQKSGTFSAYLSDLKTARLAVVNRDGTVAANKETLFL